MMNVAVQEGSPQPDRSNPAHLTQQVEGLSRDVAMRGVIGSALTDFLRPIYVDPLTLSEADRLSGIQTAEDLIPFGRSVLDILRGRLAVQTEADRDTNDALAHLVSTPAPSLFQNRDGATMLYEGIATGVTTPLRVATQIYRTEKGDVPTKKGYGLLLFEDFDHAALIEIFQRDSFGRILGSLAKGPSEFLGASSSYPQSIYSIRFFNFQNPHRPGQLMYWDAFKTEEGRVTGLSDAFHLAAQAKREEAQRLHAGQVFTASSGCPGRHKFEDKDGDLQESLITTAAEFLLGTMALSSPEFRDTLRMRGTTKV